MTLDALDEKVCPSCGESVKAQAKICRFCRHDFAVPSPDTQRRLASTRLVLIIGAVLVVAAVGFFLITQKGSEYGSVRAIVADLEVAGIPCEEELHYDDDPPGIPATELIYCSNEGGSRQFNLFLVDSGETDPLLESFQQVLAQANENLIANGIEPVADTNVVVVGTNWVVNTSDASLGADIGDALGGRIVAPETELPSD